MNLYLDYNATTPLAAEVRAAMHAALDATFGNPSSPHALGQQARRLVDDARVELARALAAQPDEIIFTSGGTEADNLAVLGAARAAARADGRRHVLIGATEHQAVLGPAAELQREGFEVEKLPVDAQGRLALDAAAALLRDDTALVSLMLANNDTGTLQPVAELAPLVHARGALLHSDVVQALGKIAIDVGALGVDLASISAHKIHGPKGVGALYRRRGISLVPLLHGGQQERTIRPGTENVPGIVGFGRACALARAHLADETSRLTALRNRFEAALLARLPGCTVNGENAPRLPNTSNVAFLGLEGELLAINLDLLGVAVSTGAACSSQSGEPSHVLLAMGQTAEQARSSLRLSLGRETDEETVDRAVEAVVEAVALLGGPS